MLKESYFMAKIFHELKKKTHLTSKEQVLHSSTELMYVNTGPISASETWVCFGVKVKPCR